MSEAKQIVLGRMSMRMLVISDPYKAPEVVVDQLIRLQCDAAVLLAMVASKDVMPVGQDDVVDGSTDE